MPRSTSVEAPPCRRGAWPCARGHILEALVRALLQGVGLRGALRRGLAYLLANARRANVPREHRTGRLRAGLELVVPA